MALWWVNGDLLQEGLFHTQVYCTQSPCPCSRPLLTHTFTGDTQTQFCLSLCGVSESWCTQGMFEPSERLWGLWGLILNVISSLLPSCWGFSFALGCGVSPQICSSTAQPLLQHLSSCWGFSTLGHGVSPCSCSSAMQAPLQHLPYCWGFSALECGIAPHSCSSAMQPLLQILTDK